MVKQNTSENTNELAQESNQVGFIILAILSLFVASWMWLQASTIESNSNSSSISGRFEEFGTLENFNEDSWFLPNDAMLGFVEVPDGPFTMGSNPSRDRQAYENERWSQNRRQGSVELQAFYISRFETTIAQYAAFVDEAGLTSEEAALRGNPYFPVANITWAKAVTYANWLDKKLREADGIPDELKDALKSGAKVMLPTEAQWEKAARGVDGRIYPWGNSPSTDYGVYGTNSVAAVGSKPCEVCTYGLSDMSGNVWELTRSPMQAYPYDAVNDAENLAADALYVMRGGSFSDAAGNVRAATRGGVDPGVRNNTIGFRLIIGWE